MKSFIFLCLLVTLCAAQIRPPSNVLDQAVRAIKTAKTTVQDAMSDMKRNRRTIDMNTRNQISNIQYQSFKNINDIQSTRLNYIKEKSEQAKEAGKNVDDCLNAVTNNMRTATQTGNRELIACENKAKQDLDTQLQAFDTEEANGQKLINQLDSVSLACYNSNIMQMANCMIIKVGLINIDIRQYQQRIAQVERQVQSNKNNIITSQYSCNNNAVTKVRNASSQAIYDVTDCLKN
ncbi:hypothetical protein WN48_00877 [Eufriesea mexicana]|uniref:uncharacterized protein LOC108547645 n=1 Tax=Eufriesea mexicana TaxID=516756 RepID=UPI00083BAE80|nr:PREDICTED: uncharacterized protein LOC108547645 [Eufriesea mexicana]OAD58077.1 hypothetical protein WN48_00877 [Eufriesea mexicana]